MNSSARHVAYDLRPAKQTERMLVVDILKLLGTAGLAVHRYPYIGLGGAVFCDFEILFRYLGIQRMVSIEHSPTLLGRCRFNRPFKFIDIYHGSTSDYLTSAEFSAPPLVWLDYDWRLSSTVTSDLEILGARLPLGGVFFVTLCAEPPRVFVEQKLDAAARVDWLNEELQDAAANCDISDVSNARFRFYVERVVKTAVRYAFAARTDGKITPLLSLFYRDSAWMYTFGAAFVSDITAKSVRTALKANLPFLSTRKAFEIPDFNMSVRERKLFDQVCSGKRRRTKAPQYVSKLGFSDEDVRNYGNLMRYLPRYAQTFV